jgi:flavodoxin
VKDGESLFSLLVTFHCALFLEDTVARVLIVYMSRGGTTERMAAFIAEGVRIAGHDAETRRSAEIGSGSDLAGFDGYIFGCPTDHLDMPPDFKSFLSIAKSAGLKGKAGGAFSSRSHPSSEDGAAADRVFEVMESGLEMRMSSLGPFNLDAKVMESGEGLRACQAYGRALGEIL